MQDQISLEEYEHRERRNLFLMFLGLVFLVVVVLFVALPRMAEGSVVRYEAGIKRDPGGVYMEGMSPRDLGPVDSDRAILFVHGFSGSPSNYNDLPDMVALDGWRVRCMVVAGHCTKPHDFEAATADQMLNSVVIELQALKAKYKHVVLVGHSLGGALVTLAAAREPVDALILCAPFFGLVIEEHLPTPVQKMIIAAMPYLRWLPRPEEGEPVAYAPNRKFINSYDWIPTRAALTCKGIGQQVYNENAIDKVKCPVLLLHSYGDKVNSPAASARAFERFPNPDKRAAWFEKSDHIIFWDYDRLPTIYEVRAFLDREFPTT